MSEIEVLENIAIKAVHRLRTETLSSGQPFMINAKNLPPDQCYLEFPDHSIQLVTFVKRRNDFIPVRNLGARDRERLRNVWVYNAYYATWGFPKRFKENDHRLQMLFLGLKDADLSEMRVGLRAKKGGHNVPRYDIENNFYGNLEMLNEHYQLLDHLQIVDTSEFLPKPLATFKGTELISSVRKKELPDWFTRHLPLLAEKIIK